MECGLNICCFNIDASIPTFSQLAEEFGWTDFPIYNPTTTTSTTVISPTTTTSSSTSTSTTILSSTSTTTTLQPTTTTSTSTSTSTSSTSTSTSTSSSTTTTTTLEPTTTTSTSTSTSSTTTSTSTSTTSTTTQEPTTTTTSTSTSTTTLPPLNFNIGFICNSVSGETTLFGNSATGGSGTGYQYSSNFFTSEPAALANTSWVSASSTAFINFLVPGTYWISLRDSLGNIIAKSVTTTCTTTTSSTTSTTTIQPTTTTSTTVNTLCVGPNCGVNYEGYGNLYNWFAIFGSGAQTNSGRNVGAIVNINQPGFTDERNQWRVPTTTDWDTLVTFLGGTSIAGGKLKTVCTTPFTTNNGIWNSPNVGAINQFNFAAVPGGRRVGNAGGASAGVFDAININCSYWTSTNSGLSAFFRFMASTSNQVTSNSLDRQYGFSIRLVRPATSQELTLTDGTTSNQNSILPHYVGNSRTYITVKIGTQVWTAQNLIDNVYNNGTIIPEVTSNTTWNTLTTGARCSYNNGSITSDQGQIALCGVPN